MFVQMQIHQIDDIIALTVLLFRKIEYGFFFSFASLQPLKQILSTVCLCGSFFISVSFKI